MEQVELGEMIQFTLGKNATRLKNTGSEIYTVDDFEKDLISVKETGEIKKCIVNLIKSKAAPLSDETSRKCITSNFLECSFDIMKLDPWYFCYQFNEGKDIEQQKEMSLQGTTISVKKLNINSISKLKIRLPDIEKQRQIGNIYRQGIIQRELLMKQAENIMNLSIRIIREMEENQNGRK